ncbi:hypothetical protein EC9_50030 [Rosistilla ulvae]|uniref:Uncharacterized protein n=1 Tax=Rosistilla ulvae TaxID=1930277 RepID=A0A517M7D2_9BACT|nr:hypothetical protein [Rosistilla ulvae]QDS90786.1 hypothetical protein EC9_50030 [Rosistilla ulvae]
MSVADPTTHREEHPQPSLKISQFDQVSSLLMALLMFVGFFVFFMFMIWLLDRLNFKSGEVVVAIVEEAAGRGENAEGFERDFEPPGQEEVEELTEPTLTDTLQAVTDAVSSVAASLDSMNTDAAASTSGSGQGDSRPPGPEGEGEDIVPRFERWNLKFQAKSMASYAEQLDFYKIELGAIGGSTEGVDYASNLAKAPKKKHNPDTSTEKRLYFRFTQAGPLERWDKTLLGKAGVGVGAGRHVLKFIPPNLENILAHTELEYAKEKGYPSVTQIAKTIFESQPGGDGHQFVVIEQRYRKAK